MVYPYERLLTHTIFMNDNPSIKNPFTASYILAYSLSRFLHHVNYNQLFLNVDAHS